VKGVDEICDLLLSTDDDEVAALGKRAGCLVPWMRPSALATDVATSVDVAIHALDWYEGARGLVDGLLLLQPTSPFRRRESVMCGLALFAEDRTRPVVGVSTAPVHPAHTYRMMGGVLAPFLESPADARTQDLGDAYALNGALYLIAPDMLRSRRSFFDSRMAPVIMDAPGEDVDIDTERDWRIAEALVLAGQVPVPIST
jgi:CMP-N,N'-diacetyllegionaminic acid synthase